MTEAKQFFYALALLILGTEFCLLSDKHSFVFSRELFVQSALLFYLLYTLLEYCIRLILNKPYVPLFSAPLALLVFFLFHNIGNLIVISFAALISFFLRMLFCFPPKKTTALLFGCFVLDGIAVYMRFARHILLGSYSTDRLLFLCLVILTLSSLQQLIFEKNKGAFPFHFFLLMAILIFLLPVKKTPIDWTPVKQKIQQAADATYDTLYSVNGFFKTNTYTSGYSSFSVTGGKLKKNKTKQLALRTGDYPYYIYTEKDTGVKKLVKKTTYLEGRAEADVSGLIDFLSLLYENNIDAETASFFSQISTMEIEYEYLNTKDLIVPSGSILLTDEVGQPLYDSDLLHKKGYRIKCVYLDVDYGSAYLTKLFKSSKPVAPLSYDKACDYMKALYNLDFSSMVSKEDYEAALEEDADSYLDSSGATEKMKSLAKELASGGTNDYDTCKKIENYLRAYSYNTNASGGYNKASTMATPEGMADIANRFLFDTKEGYCVHYTASMIMLLRLNGIPARAVMGYRYNFPTAMQKEYNVSSDCAHTWPQAYIEGAGWISFEPTGAYPTAEIRSWKRGTSEFTQNSIAPSSLNQEPQSEDIGAVKKEKQALRMHILKITGIVTGCIILLLILMVLGTLLARKLTYRFSTPKKRLKTDVELIKKYLKKSSDTDICDRGLLYDYLSIAPSEQKDALKRIFDLYYQCEYGSSLNVNISEEESAFVRDIRKGLKR